MKRLEKYLSKNKRLVWIIAGCLGALGFLMLYKLGSLTNGVSTGEYRAATTPIGWHGLFINPLDFPLQFARSVIAWIDPSRGVTLLRLPNAFIGAMSIISFAWLLKLQHGLRTTVLGTLLFSTSAYVLHISRIASFDALYLVAVPLMLATVITIQKKPQNSWSFILGAFICSMLLTIPGLVWLVAWIVFCYWGPLYEAWKGLSARSKTTSSALLSIWLLPVAVAVWQKSGNLLTWLGLPSNIPSPLHMIKNIALVPSHLFYRGEFNPTLWLGKAPILDFFTLIVCVIGIFFFASNWQSSRSRLLGGLFIVGILLIGMGGPVPLALLVPVLYLCAATGAAYLVREWLNVFPLNPIARGFGLSLIVIAIIFSCTYNIRAYFVAWPHNKETIQAFSYKLKQ